MLGDVRWRRVTGKGVVVGDKVEAVVFSLEFEVLAHCTEKIAYMQPAARLYPGKNSQFKLLVLIQNIVEILYKNDLTVNVFAVVFRLVRIRYALPDTADLVGGVFSLGFHPGLPMRMCFYRQRFKSQMDKLRTAAKDVQKI